MSKKRNSNNNLQQFVLYKLYIIIIIITGINITIIIIILIIIIIFIIIIIRLLCIKDTSSPESLISLWQNYCLTTSLEFWPIYILLVFRIQPTTIDFNLMLLKFIRSAEPHSEVF